MLKQGKSKKAFEHNVKTEVESGKPVKQSLAIAYDIKRRNSKKMAEGGTAILKENYDQQEDQPSSITEAIRRKKMAEGGMVDLDLNEEEHQPNGYDEQNRLAAHHDFEEDMDHLHQPLDSNEHTEEIDHDEHDMISALRARIRKKHLG